MAVMLFLVVLVALFALKWRQDCIPIMQVLTILLVNQILYSASELLGYIDSRNSLLCTLSIIGRMAFIVASNFWIIFITRLVYLEAMAPGKYFNLVHFVFKNIVLTYIPSLVLCVFLLIIINISSTDSERLCWRIITNKEALDYVIYGTTFILPNLVASAIIVLYLVKLYRLPSCKWTFFLVFSFTSLVFSLYYIAIRMWEILGSGTDMQYFNMIMLGEPIVFGVCYIVVYIKQKRKSEALSSDITIRGSEGEASFID